jgi:intron-binding protein aquarius
VFERVSELQPAFENLFARPTELTLVTGEMFPTKRALDDELDGTVMTGVEHLGQYVFEMTKAKVQQLKEGGGQLPQPVLEEEEEDDVVEEENEDMVVEDEEDIVDEESEESEEE